MDVVNLYFHAGLVQRGMQILLPTSLSIRRWDSAGMGPVECCDLIKHSFPARCTVSAHLMLGKALMHISSEQGAAASQGLSVRALPSMNLELHNSRSWETCFPPHSFSGFV